MDTAIRPGPRSKRGVGHEGSKELGELIRAKREQMGLSQEEFARMVGWSSRGTLSPIEAGSRAVTAEDKVQRLAQLLGIPADTIYTMQGYIPHDIYYTIAEFSENQMAQLRSSLRALT